MESIEIRDVKLSSLIVSTNKKNVEFDATKVQAILQVHYDFSSQQSKNISYRVVVGESPKKSLFHVKCEYSFTINNDNFVDEEIVMAAMDILQPKIEEILSFISFEAGFIPTNN